MDNCYVCGDPLADVHGVIACESCFSKAQAFQGAMGLILRAQLGFMREPICHS